MHGDLAVVQRLVAEVDGVSADMLEQLLQRLQGAIQLPECLRVIGYLRRLAAFPGTQWYSVLWDVGGRVPKDGSSKEAWLGGTLVCLCAFVAAPQCIIHVFLCRAGAATGVPAAARGLDRRAGG